MLHYHGGYKTAFGFQLPRTYSSLAAGDRQASRQARIPRASPLHPWDPRREADMGQKRTDRPPTEREFQEAERLADLERYERGPSTGPLNWGLHTLHNQLSAAAAHYRRSDLQGQRDAVADAAFAVERFLRSQGFNAATLEPLMRPALALVEREKNRLDLMFCERKRGGAPSRSIDDYCKIGATAALAEAWLTCHSDKVEKTDAKLKRFCRFVAGPWLGDLSLAKVKAAREMVSQEAKDHPAVRWAAFFREHIETAQQLGGAEAAIKIVARSLNRNGSIMAGPTN